MQFLQLYLLYHVQLFVRVSNAVFQEAVHFTLLLLHKAVTLDSLLNQDIHHDKLLLSLLSQASGILVCLKLHQDQLWTVW